MKMKSLLFSWKFPIANVILALLVCGAACGQVAPPSGERLRALAGKFLVGYASHDDFWTLPDAATYEATASSEFNILTPENQMKFDVTEPEQNTFNFAPGDMHVQFAQANGMKVHGHNLVWYNQLPSWVTNTTWTAAQLTAVMNNHIDNVVGHYKGEVALWDVVNEAFNDDGTLRASVWETTIGPQYVGMAFQRARADDPNAILVYNDFNIETVNAKSDALLNLVTSFQQQGIPIDAIGLQMHLTSGGIDISSLTANMQRFAQLGLQIYITEMDVRYTTPMSASDLQSQATIYEGILNACLQQPACKGLQTWGFTDKYSWIPGTFPGMGQALEFDQNYAAKPAYFALQSDLSTLAPGFTLSASPANVAVNLGATAASSIAVTPSGGFAGNVALSASGLPAGVTAAFSPASTTAASTVTFTASSAATTGAFNVMITGTSGTLTATAPITLTVSTPTTPNFSLSASLASVSVNAGASAADTITITPSGGFAGSVALAASGLPPGVTAAFSPASTTGTSTLTFTASGTATAGTSTVTVTGTSGSLTHTVAITLTVSTVSGTGGVTVATTINSNSGFFDDEGVKISNTAAITALSVTINVQNTGGLSFSGQYNTVGGSIVDSHSSTATVITYQYSLSSGQTLSPGTGYLFDAQMSGTGTVHPVSGDTFTVTYTTGGQTFTQTGVF